MMADQVDWRAVHARAPEVQAAWAVLAFAVADVVYGKGSKVANESAEVLHAAAVAYVRAYDVATATQQVGADG
jgi:hypothetical protein